MRKRYLIAYDIADSKRLYRIHKKIQAYAIGGQKSFYECWLTTSELAECRNTLITLIHESEDKLFMFQLNANIQPRLFGTATLVAFDQPFLIV